MAKRARVIPLRKDGKYAGSRSAGGPGEDVPTAATTAVLDVDDCPTVNTPSAVRIGNGRGAGGMLTRLGEPDSAPRIRQVATEYGVTETDVQRHYADLLAESDGDAAAADRRLAARVRQQQIVELTPGIVNLAPPGSQADQYVYGPDGRLAEVYYASYGSNLYADRFNAYISGGHPDGSARTYEGARDKTPPAEDLPVALNGTLFYAGESRVWTGGVAFLNPQRSGKTLGRAYLLSAEQFDDVVAQENHDAVGSHRVDLNAAVAEGKTVGKGVYGTLVHVGDHNGRPVLTFTSPFTTAQARRGNLTVTPDGVTANRATRDAGAPARRAAHDRTQQRLPESERVPFKEDWAVYGNTPSTAYVAMISSGLEETHGLPADQIREYFAGSF